MSEPVTSLVQRETVLDPHAILVALCRPDCDLVSEGLPAVDAAVQALSCQDAEFRLRRVQPATMLGRVMELQLADQAPSLLGRKGFVERGRLMRVQVVKHHANALRPGEVQVHQSLHLGREVQLGALPGHSYLAPAGQGLHRHEDVGRTGTLVLIVIERRLTRGHGARCTRLRHQLHRLFVEADDWTHGIVRLCVQLKHVFHGAYEVCAYRSHAPLLAPPGLHIPLFRVRRTVSSQMLSTILSSTRRSARSCRVQRVRPEGGPLQASARRWASWRPSNRRGLPRLCRSESAASRDSSTKRLRTRSTVATPTRRLAAIASSVSRSAAATTINARFIRRALALPLLVSASNLPRSSSVNSTTYFFKASSLPPAWQERVCHNTVLNITVAEH